jgi:hypothetical protein
MLCAFGGPPNILRLYGRGYTDHAEKWAESKGVYGLEEYKIQKNYTSMDGLPTTLSQRPTQSTKGSASAPLRESSIHMSLDFASEL